MAMPTTVPAPDKFVVSAQIQTLCYALMVVGLGAFGFGLMMEPARAWGAFLIGLFYTVSLGLGGLFFSSIQHLTKAGWSVTVRRFAEAFTSFLPIAFGLVLVFLIGSPKLYEWLNAEKVASDPLIRAKVGYLNFTFFVVRLFFFFGVWNLFRFLIVGNSIKQDLSGEDSLTIANVKYSIAFILIFALTYSFFSFDLLMSLDPHWFSTIFGVYCFAGLFQSSLALLALFIIFGMKKGLLRGYVDENHLHDVGKFTFAFTVFWAYIAYSQYMLIWYANLPEETIFFIPRTQGAWTGVTLFLVIGKFIVPFFMLLPRGSKRNPAILAPVCVLILFMQFVDLYWLVFPNIHPDQVKFPILEVLVTMGFLAGFLTTTFRFLSRNKIIPIRDPRLKEALHHHVIY